MRMAVILFSTLSAIAIAAGDWSSFESPKLFSVSVTSRIHGYVCFADGMVRFYWFRTEVGSTLKAIRHNRQIEVRRRDDDTLLLRLRHASPRAIKPHALVKEKYTRRPGASNIAVRLIGVRTTSVAIMASLLIFPVLVLGGLRIRDARRKPGLCDHCEYDLTGNVSGICPECGSAIGRAKSENVKIS